MSYKALARAAKLITRDRTTRADIARRRIRRVRRLLRQVRELDTQITRLVAALGTSLTTIYGIGNLTAAEIIAEVGDAARYPTKARFAMANGTAPIEASSGRITRHRLNRGGNRQLNRALHNAAITPIARPGTEGRCYYKTAPPTRKNQKRSHPHPQTTHLRPGLDPPPTHHQHPPNPPSLDIGAHLSRSPDAEGRVAPIRTHPHIGRRQVSRRPPLRPSARKSRRTRA